MTIADTIAYVLTGLIAAIVIVRTIVWLRRNGLFCIVLVIFFGIVACAFFVWGVIASVSVNWDVPYMALTPAKNFDAAMAGLPYFILAAIAAGLTGLFIHLFGKETDKYCAELRRQAGPAYVSGDSIARLKASGYKNPPFGQSK